MRVPNLVELRIVGAILKACFDWLGFGPKLIRLTTPFEYIVQSSSWLEIEQLMLESFNIGPSW
jgi:hypothetical protein